MDPLSKPGVERMDCLLLASTYFLLLLLLDPTALDIYHSAKGNIIISPWNFFSPRHELQSNPWNSLPGPRRTSVHVEIGTRSNRFRILTLATD